MTELLRKPKDTCKESGPLDLSTSIHALKEFLPSSLIKTLDQISKDTTGSWPPRDPLELDDLVDCERLLSNMLYSDSHPSDIGSTGHHTPRDVFESRGNRELSLSESMVDSWGLPTAAYLEKNIDNSMWFRSPERIIDQRDSSSNSYDLNRSASGSISYEVCLPLSSQLSPLLPAVLSGCTSLVTNNSSAYKQVPSLLAPSARYPMATISSDAVPKSFTMQSGPKANPSARRELFPGDQLSASDCGSYTSPPLTPRQGQPPLSPTEDVARPIRTSLIAYIPLSPASPCPETDNASPHEFVDPPLLEPDANAREREKPRLLRESSYNMDLSTSG